VPLKSTKVYGEASHKVLVRHLTHIAAVFAAVFAAAQPNNAEAAESAEALSRFISVVIWVGLTGFEPATHGLGNRNRHFMACRDVSPSGIF
jgi:hypothetical protein